ncbi:hypothetical protein ACJ6WD_09615 [Streptomyces sp. VTCC 41912]|uniref:hypothetical protein n=1 Tax=Streptomyces TaxID=1883 RepID=UPI002F25FBF0
MTTRFAPGAHVHHGGQIWARTLPGDTGVILVVKGPDVHDDHEGVDPGTRMFNESA